MNNETKLGAGSMEQEQETNGTDESPLKCVLFGGTISLLIVGLAFHFLGPFRSLLLCAWGAGAYVTLWFMGRRVKRAYKTHWFDPMKHDESEQAVWKKIAALMDAEPITHDSTFRYPASNRWLDNLALLILALFFLSTIVLIISPHPDALASTGIFKWAFPVGTLALFGTVLTVFYQVRLTARTQNRGQWILTVRRKMADLISLYDTEGDSDKPPSVEVDKRITELELLLNPEDRLHRTLLTLMRTLHGIYDNPLDEETKSNLQDTFPNEKKNDSEEASDDTEEVSADTWKARCIRLSNVILKYEWERVKHAE